MNGDRETILDYMARCDQAFRPFAPITLPEFFQGRKQHIERLAGELTSPGRQVAIYGERGVGKTSLAKLADFYANFSDEATHFVRCEQHQTYDKVFGQFLALAGSTYAPSSMESETQTGVGLGGSLLSAERSRRARVTSEALQAARTIGPPLLLKVFGDRPGLLILDEYDRIQDKATHTRLAETLKHFSDAGSKTKIIVVGVAETLSELVGEHESLTRCLAQIKLGRMTRDELGEIITVGEERIGLVFKDNVRRKIVGLSDGFPFYTHLLCSYCAEEAGKTLSQNPSARVVVSETEYDKAVRKAVEGAESSLVESYQAAVITVKRKTDIFKHILWAIAYSDDVEVQVKDIAGNIELLAGTAVSPQSLSNPLGTLTKKEKNSVLTRARQGYYKFSNPLMRAYVRLMIEKTSIDRGGQHRFPWFRDE